MKTKFIEDEISLPGDPELRQSPDVLHISRIDQFSEKDRTGGRSLDTLIVIMNDGEHLWPVCDSVCDFCNL